MSQSKAYNVALFLVPALIWGSTWFVIKYQLGPVNPLWSVSYRFTLGGVLLIIYCLLRGINLRFSATEHARIALQGVILFGFLYWLVYIAEEELTSALVAISFSTIIFFNVLFGSVFLKKKTTKKVYIGAALGLSGIALLYYQDLTSLQYESLPVYNMVICMFGVAVASSGNIVSAVNQAKGIPVIQANAYGMVYGGLTMAVIATFLGIEPTFDFSAPYILSLLYLAVLGSVVAFGAYLTLVGKIGPDRAAYIMITVPVTALAISVVLEDYPLTLLALGGTILILAGNLIVLKK